MDTRFGAFYNSTCASALVIYFTHTPELVHIFYYRDNITNGYRCFISEIVSVKLLVTVNIYLKRYPSTYCLIQCRCFICSNF